MKLYAFVLALALLSGLTQAETITVLNAGPSTNYLSIVCGVPTVNSVAEHFDDTGQPVAIVRVVTSCHGSGRGSRNHYYMACARVTWSSNGAGIVSQEGITSGNWLQGNPAVPCSVYADPTAVYTRDDGGTLSTSTLPNGTRAVLTLP